MILGPTVMAPLLMESFDIRLASRDDPSAVQYLVIFLTMNEDLAAFVMTGAVVAELTLLT